MNLTEDGVKPRHGHPCQIQTQLGSSFLITHYACTLVCNTAMYYTKLTKHAYIIRKLLHTYRLSFYHNLNKKCESITENTLPPMF